MLYVVIDMLLSNGQFDAHSKRTPNVLIAIVLGKGAGRYLQADTMAGAEELRGVPAIDSVALDATGFDQ